MSGLGCDDEEEDIFRQLAHVELGQVAKPDKRTGRGKTSGCNALVLQKKKKRQHNDDLLVELEEAERKARPVESNNIIYQKHIRSFQKMWVATTKSANMRRNCCRGRETSNMFKKNDGKHSFGRMLSLRMPTKTVNKKRASWNNCESPNNRKKEDAAGQLFRNHQKCLAGLVHAAHMCEEPPAEQHRSSRSTCLACCNRRGVLPQEPRRVQPPPREDSKSAAPVSSTGGLRCFLLFMLLTQMCWLEVRL